MKLYEVTCNMVDDKRTKHTFKFTVPAVDKEHAIRCGIDIAYAINESTDHRIKIITTDARELSKSVDISEKR